MLCAASCAIASEENTGVECTDAECGGGTLWDGEDLSESHAALVCQHFAEGCMVAGAGTGIDVPTVGNPDRNPHAVWAGTGFCD